MGKERKRKEPEKKKKKKKEKEAEKQPEPETSDSSSDSSSSSSTPAKEPPKKKKRERSRSRSKSSHHGHRRSRSKDRRGPSIRRTRSRSRSRERRRSRSRSPPRYRHEHGDFLRPMGREYRERERDRDRERYETKNTQFQLQLARGLEYDRYGRVLTPQHRPYDPERTYRPSHLLPSLNWPLPSGDNVMKTPSPYRPVRAPSEEIDDETIEKIVAMNSMGIQLTVDQIKRLQHHHSAEIEQKVRETPVKKPVIEAVKLPEVKKENEQEDSNKTVRVLEFQEDETKQPTTPKRQTTAQPEGLQQKNPTPTKQEIPAAQHELTEEKKSTPPEQQNPVKVMESTEADQEIQGEEIQGEFIEPTPPNKKSRLGKNKKGKEVVEMVDIGSDAEDLDAFERPTVSNTKLNIKMPFKKPVASTLEKLEKEKHLDDVLDSVALVEPHVERKSRGKKRGKGGKGNKPDDSSRQQDIVPQKISPAKSSATKIPQKQKKKKKIGKRELMTVQILKRQYKDCFLSR